MKVWRRGNGTKFRSRQQRLRERARRKEEKERQKKNTEELLYRILGDRPKMNIEMFTWAYNEAHKSDIISEIKAVGYIKK